MTTPSGYKNKELILRDELALQRTSLANERTMLAYVRTAIMVFVSSVSLIRFFPDSPMAQLFGWTLVPAGLAVAGFGFWRFAALRKSILDVLNDSDATDRET